MPLFFIYVILSFLLLQMTYDKKESTATASKDLDYHRLLRENQALKEIVAEKELEIRVKDALLKKTTLNIKNG